MLKPQSGFILFYALLILQMMIGISTYMVHNALQEIKMNQSSWRHQQQATLTEQLLTQTEKMLQTHTSSCMIPHTATEDLLGRPVDWWELYSCQGQLSQVKYYYVIEDIMQDACAEVIGQDQLGARFFRITLVSYSIKNKEKWILQSMTLKSDNGQDQCHGSHHQVNPGRQSWNQYEY